MDLKTMMQSYIDFQCDVVTRRTEYNLKRARDRAHILEGLRRAVDIIDDIIATIRGCKGGSGEARTAIMEKFGFDEVQATAIVQLQLGRLAGLEIQRIDNELQELALRIEELQNLLDDKYLLLANIKEELTEISEKFGDDRRTEIVPVSGEVDIEDLIPVEDCVITLTHFGYVKRQPTDLYKSQKRGGRGITGLTRRDEDFVAELYICSTHDNLLFMTNKGRVYKLKGYEIPEGSRTSRGMNIVNLLPLWPEEKVTTVIRVADFDAAEYIVMVTRKGFIKKSNLSLYRNIYRKGVFGIILNEDDDLAWVRLTDGTQDLIVATGQGMAIRFNEKDVRSVGRIARGVKAISLSEGDTVVGMSTIRDGSMLLTVTEDGKGRLTDVEGYRLQHRGGKGIINYPRNMKAVIAGVKAVDTDDDVILISQTGIIIRFHVADINATGRYGQGVRVMRVAEDDRIVTVARAERDTEEDYESDENTEQILPEPSEGETEEIDPED
jgi:DNA gyrase subunit A